MKKSVVVLLVFLFVVSSLGATFGRVSAQPLSPTSGPGPKVTPVSGDAEFSVETVTIASLPGVVTLGSGMLAPVGFDAGEKQFGGDGVRISGLDSGVVSACFPLKGVSVGWGGQVARWTGSTWELLPSTVSAPDESNRSWGCANVSANGTYAFIKWIVDASLLPDAKPECGYTIYEVYALGESSYNPATNTATGYFDGFMIYSMTNFTSMNVTITMIGSDPAGAIVMEGSASGTLHAEDVLYYYLEVDPTLPFTATYPINSITYHLEFDTCEMDVTTGRD